MDKLSLLFTIVPFILVYFTLCALENVDNYHLYISGRSISPSFWNVCQIFAKPEYNIVLAVSLIVIIGVGSWMSSYLILRNDYYLLEEVSYGKIMSPKKTTPWNNYYTVRELREMCRQRGLSPWGLKRELVSRLTGTE